jgi:hypothetical protein
MQNEIGADGQAEHPQAAERPFEKDHEPPENAVSG